MPEVDIRPLPIPEDYAFPYIVEDVERGDYAACEQKLLAVLPEYEHMPEVRLFILDQLGFFAQFQAYAAEKREDQLAHLNRTLDYYSLGDSLASADPVRFKLHRATFLRGQAEALEELGRLEEALQKTMAMIPMTGIGTGSKKDAAAAGAVEMAVNIRLSMGKIRGTFKPFSIAWCLTPTRKFLSRPKRN